MEGTRYLQLRSSWNRAPKTTDPIKVATVPMVPKSPRDGRDKVPAAPFFLELVEVGLPLVLVLLPEEDQGDDETDLPCAFAYVFQRLFVQFRLHKGLGNKR